MRQHRHDTGAIDYIGLDGVSLSRLNLCLESAMPFVSRDENGNITALSERESDAYGESLAADHPDVLAYREQERRIAAAKDLLSSSDAETVRVIEDLIEVLVDRRLIMLTDLPLPAQQKIISRQSTRQTLNRLDNMIVDADDIL